METTLMKRKPGPKPRVFTPEQINQVEILASKGLSMGMIASTLDFSRDGLYDHMKNNKEMKEAVDRGKKKANGKVVLSAFEQAVSGKSPAMTIFWLKTQCRWKEVQHVQHEGSIGLEALITKSKEKLVQDTTEQLEEATLDEIPEE